QMKASGMALSVPNPRRCRQNVWRRPGERGDPVITERADTLEHQGIRPGILGPRFRGDDNKRSRTKIMTSILTPSHAPARCAHAGRAAPATHSQLASAFQSALLQSAPANRSAL